MRHVKLNMNGDTASTLLAELRTAYDALTVAQAAIKALTIHGRNYQTYMEPSEFYKSDLQRKSDQHAALQEMIEYIAECYVNINAQADNSPAKGSAL